MAKKKKKKKKIQTNVKQIYWEENWTIWRNSDIWLLLFHEARNLRG